MAIANSTVPQTIPASVYTSAGNSAITNVYLCNHTGSAVTINMYLVPNAGTAGVANIIYSSVSIPANNTFVMDTEKIVMSNGESLQASCSAASAVTATVSYIGV